MYFDFTWCPGVDEHTPACVQILGARAGEEEEGREGSALAGADQVYLVETYCADYTDGIGGTVQRATLMLHSCIANVQR